MLRLLLLRRRPSPQEVRDQPELPRRLIGTIIQEFDTVAGLNTAIGRSTVLPMIIRLRLLAGLAIVMKNPLEQLSRSRQSRAVGPQFRQSAGARSDRDPQRASGFSGGMSEVSHLKMQSHLT